MTCALSMALILYILGTAIPANSPVEILVVASSAWAQFPFACCLLAAAQLSSSFAFFMGMLAVYTEDFLAKHEAEVQTVLKLRCFLPDCGASVARLESVRLGLCTASNLAGLDGTLSFCRVPGEHACAERMCGATRP